MPRRPPALRLQRALLLGLLLLLHGAALWWLEHTPSSGRAQDAPPQAARIVLRLLSLPTPAAAPPAALARSAPTRPGALRSERPAAAAAAAAAAPPPITPAAGAPPTAAPVTAAPPSMPAPAPLDLQLRPSRAASAPPSALATGDARANTGRGALGERMGRALGEDRRVTEERMLGEGRMRIRQGAECLDVHEARTAQLDPFSMATRPTPRSVKSCD